MIWNHSLPWTGSRPRTPCFETTPAELEKGVEFFVGWCSRVVFTPRKNPACGLWWVMPSCVCPVVQVIKWHWFKQKLHRTRNGIVNVFDLPSTKANQLDPQNRPMLVETQLVATPNSWHLKECNFPVNELTLFASPSLGFRLKSRIFRKISLVSFYDIPVLHWSQLHIRIRG